MDSKQGKIVVGIDPDSQAYGVAVYVDGALDSLCQLTTQLLLPKLEELSQKGRELLICIENVLANDFCYSMTFAPGTKPAAKEKIRQNRMLKAGRCQHSQEELMRWLDHYKIRYMLLPPQSGNWAQKREQFEKITGWKKQSNADTRSAAFFGFLALKK